MASSQTSIEPHGRHGKSSAPTSRSWRAGMHGQRAGVVVGEPHRPGGQPIEVRRVELGAAVAAEQVPVEAVEQHHDDVPGSSHRGGPYSSQRRPGSVWVRHEPADDPLLEGLNPVQRGGRHPRRRAAAHRGRRRLGQDPGAHPPHRPPDPRPRRQPVRDPGHHLHQQGRRRDEAPRRRARRPGRREDVGVDVPLRVRADPAARRRPARLPVAVHDLRPGRRRPPHRLRASATSTSTPSGSRPGRCTPRSARPRTTHVVGRRVRRAGQGDLRAQDRRRLPRVPGPPPARRRHGLRRPARQRPSSCSRRHPDVLEHYQPPLQARPRRRVPGHQHRPERARPAARPRSTATSASWATATSRSTRFRGADIRNILEFEDAFPDVTVVVLEQNYRSTQTILDAANAVIANNLGRKPKELWTDRGDGRPDRPLPRRRRGRRGAVGHPRDRQAARRRRPALGRHRRLLPHQRPEPGGGGEPHPHRRARTRSSAAPASTTGARSRTRSPT